MDKIVNVSYGSTTVMSCNVKNDVHVYQPVLVVLTRTSSGLGLKYMYQAECASPTAATPFIIIFHHLLSMIFQKQNDDESSKNVLYVITMR